MAPNRIQRLVAVGACYVDTILSVPHYPAEDEKVRASSVTRRRGGNCPNSCEVLGQLIRPEHGVELVLVSVLPAPSSPGTQLVRDSLAPNVDLSRCIFRHDHGEAPASYVVKSLAAGSRTIVNHNDLPEMTFDEFTAAVSGMMDDDDDDDHPKQPPTWFHFEGRIPAVTLRCMKWLRERRGGGERVRLSVEIEKPGREGLRELSGLADVVFYSKSWAQHQGYHEQLACVSGEHDGGFAQNARLLFVTWGEEGATALLPEEATSVREEAYLPPDSSIVDAVGAGDTFIAGALFSLICKGRYGKGADELSHTLRYAVRLAGTKITQEGFAGLDRVQY